MPSGLRTGLPTKRLAVSGRIHISDTEPKPIDGTPVLWIRGDGDLVIGDQSSFDVGVLERYAAGGGDVREEVITNSSHGPFIDHLDDCIALLFDFLT